MGKPHEIAIIAAPRTGTNYFCDTMGEFPEIANFFELFNPRGAFGLDAFPDVFEILSENFNFDVKSAEDPELINAARNNPVDFLDKLGRSVTSLGKDFFTYKIFPNQISQDFLEEILRDTNRSFILIARRRIDTFISFKKAMQFDTWVNRPTGNVLIEATYEEFMTWSAAQDKWYENAVDILRKHDKNCIFLSYDADLNVPKETLVEKQYLALKSLGADASFPQNIEAPRFSKQDKEIGPFKKISNGEELKQALMEKKLLRTYALRNAFTNMKP